MSEAASLPGLDLIVGEATDAQCRVYARLNDSTGRLTGTITGPTCEYAQTLTASVEFRDRGPGSSLLAEAIVPDPCFWTPALPLLYDVEIQLEREGKVVAQTRRLFGMRRLGTRGRNLILGRERWVLRGVEMESAQVRDCVDAEAALLADYPSEFTCENASRLGVLMAATVDPSRQSFADELRRLSRWPAIGMIILAGEPPAGVSLRSLAPNVLFGRWFRADKPVQPAGWEQIAFCRFDDAATFGQATRDCQLPIVAVRQDVTMNKDVAEARRRCDLLQAELAAVGDYAGYVMHDGDVYLL